MTSIQVQLLGQLMEPDPSNLLEVEDTLNRTSFRTSDVEGLPVSMTCRAGQLFVHGHC